MIRLGLIVLAVVASSCAALAWHTAPVVLEDYPDAHVRITRVGLRCRLEVQTPRALIQTGSTWCTPVYRTTP
jgi:hypothetical protein